MYTIFTGSILVSLHFAHISSDPTVCFLEKAIFYDIDLRAPSDAVWRSQSGIYLQNVPLRG